MSEAAPSQVIDVLPPEGEEENPLAPHERPWPRVWMAPFLQSLSMIPDVSSACRVATVGRSTVYENRDRNPDFRSAWDEALELCRDLIQRNAHRWITTGVPVKQVKRHTKTKKDAAGNILETIEETFETEGSERSATLMIFWLKAWYPDRYRWSERVEATGADGGPIRVESLDSIDRQIAELEAEIIRRDRYGPVEEELAEIEA